VTSYDFSFSLLLGKKLRDARVSTYLLRRWAVVVLYFDGAGQVGKYVEYLGLGGLVLRQREALSRDIRSSSIPFALNPSLPLDRLPACCARPHTYLLLGQFPVFRQFFPPPPLSPPCTALQKPSSWAIVIVLFNFPARADSPGYSSIQLARIYVE
jgi:hypothetical protein